MMNVSASIGHAKNSTLLTDVYDSEYAYLTWTEDSNTLSLSMTRKAVEEFARHIDAIQAALKKFDAAEDRDEEAGDDHHGSADDREPNA